MRVPKFTISTFKTSLLTAILAPLFSFIVLIVEIPNKKSNLLWFLLVPSVLSAVFSIIVSYCILQAKTKKIGHSYQVESKEWLAVIKRWTFCTVIASSINVFSVVFITELNTAGMFAIIASGIDFGCTAICIAGLTVKTKNNTSMTSSDNEFKVLVSTSSLNSASQS